jgi:hypothetical protein
VIDEELDTARERTHLRRALSLWASRGRVQVPEVKEGLCAPGVLTLRWIEGQPFRDFVRGSGPEERKRAALLILEHFVSSLHLDAWVHGDPHPGNWLWQTEARQWALLDYGCMLSVSPGVVRGWTGLVADLRQGHRADFFTRFVDLGFDPVALESMRGCLREVAQAMLLPWLKPGPFDLDQWGLGARLKAALGPHRVAFRAAGPSSLFLLIRVLHGTISQLSTLRASLDWAAVWDPFAPSASAPPSPRGDVPRPSAAPARLVLRVEVWREGQQTVALSLPARSALALREVVPREVQEALEHRNVSLEALQARYREESALVPGELFESDDGKGRRFRVALDWERTGLSGFQAF